MEISVPVTGVFLEEGRALDLSVSTIQGRRETMEAVVADCTELVLKVYELNASVEYLLTNKNDQLASFKTHLESDLHQKNMKVARFETGRGEFKRRNTGDHWIRAATKIGPQMRTALCQWKKTAFRQYESIIQRRKA